MDSREHHDLEVAGRVEGTTSVQIARRVEEDHRYGVYAT